MSNAYDVRNFAEKGTILVPVEMHCSSASFIATYLLYLLTHILTYLLTNLLTYLLHGAESFLES